MNRPAYTTVGQQLRLIRDDYGLFTVGALIGSFVPVAVFALSGHLTGPNHDITSAWTDSTAQNIQNGIIAILVLSGCIFSAKSVYGWGQSAFCRDRWKAVGFCVLIEGIMVFSPLFWLHVVAGIFLLVINAIATGSNLIVEDNAFRRVEEVTGKNGNGNHHALSARENPPTVMDAREIAPSNRGARKSKRQRRHEKARKILKGHPGISIPQLARKLGVTEKTAARDRDEILESQPTA